jgi:hypothetical protein
VSRDGTPITATSQLNALKGFVALALLHHGSSHPCRGGLLARIGEPNLVQIRLDPDVAGAVGLKVFDRILAAADHEEPGCPDSPEAARRALATPRQRFQIR